MGTIKRFCIVIALLISVQQVFSTSHELKIYRKKVSKLGVVVACTIGGVFGLASLSAIGLTLHLQKENKIPLIDSLVVMGVVSLIGSLGVIPSVLRLNSLYKWHKKRDKPILIFDKEGFTYEQPMGLFKERKYMRYFWSDVLSQWGHRTVNEWGSIIEYSWCYHIRGQKKVLRINVLELDIPEYLEGIIDSIRGGNRQALVQALAALDKM